MNLPHAHPILLIDNHIVGPGPSVKAEYTIP